MLDQSKTFEEKIGQVIDQTTKAQRDLRQQLSEQSKVFEEKGNQSTEQFVKTHRDLRQQLLDQSKTLRDEIQQKHETLSTLVNQMAQELRSDKTDRSALAALFKELAMRLEGEFKLSDTDTIMTINPES
jgi:seryl-tRNA synthetase